MIRYALFLFFLNCGFVQAGWLADKKNDSAIEEKICHFFCNNSDTVIEVNVRSYPYIDSLVGELARKAGIIKPLTFVICNEHEDFLDKMRVCAAGNKEKSVLFIGQSNIDQLRQQELEGLLARAITKISHNTIWQTFKNRCLLNGLFFAFAGAAIIGEKRAAGMWSMLWKNAKMRLAFEVCALFFTRLYLANRYHRSMQKEIDSDSIVLVGHTKLIEALLKRDQAKARLLPFSHVVGAFMNRLLIRKKLPLDARIGLIKQQNGLVC